MACTCTCTCSTTGEGVFAIVLLLASPLGDNQVEYVLLLSDSLHRHTVVTLMGGSLAQSMDFAQSMDCPAQSVDLCFALAIHGLTHGCAISGLRMHDEREGPLLATWPALGTVESNYM